MSEDLARPKPKRPLAARLRRWSTLLFLLPHFVLFVGFLVLPVLFGLGLSLFRWEMLSPTPPAPVGLENYAEAMRDEYFWRALRATLYFAVLAVPSTLAVALGIAVCLSSLPRWHGFFRAAFLLPTMMSVSVVGILWRWFFTNDFGLFNAWLGRFGIAIPWISDPAWAMPSIVLMTLWWTAGSSMLVLLAGLQQIPESYYEAASLDGAGAWAKFRHITLPLLRPVLLFVVVTGLIGAFQVFGQTFMVTRGGPELSTRVLVQYIYETAFNHYRMGYGAAMSWLLFLLIAVFAALQFRLGKSQR